MLKALRERLIKSSTVTNLRKSVNQSKGRPLEMVLIQTFLSTAAASGLLTMRSRNAEAPKCPKIIPPRPSYHPARNGFISVARVFFVGWVPPGKFFAISAQAGLAVGRGKHTPHLIFSGTRPRFGRRLDRGAFHATRLRHNRR